MRDARAVMHVGIANWRGEKTFPAFPAHAQPSILRIWQEAHGATIQYLNQWWPRSSASRPRSDHLLSSIRIIHDEENAHWCTRLLCHTSSPCWQLVYTKYHFDGLVQDCSIPNALALTILQSCTKPSIDLWFCIPVRIPFNIPPKLSQTQFFFFGLVWLFYIYEYRRRVTSNSFVS